MIRKLKIISAAVAALAVIVAGSLFLIPPWRHNAQIAFSKAIIYITPASHTPFPEINTSRLTPLQIKILQTARDEYAKHPVSYDANVLRYTHGAKEAWCANFVSWVMRQSGAAYRNPNSGSWRIPGVLTLREYYQVEGRYKNAGHYKPQPGDVAFYIHKSTFRLFSAEHVALVIKTDGDTMTTLGGNEQRRMQIDTQTVHAGDNYLVGFGTL
jgi:hypothetical protein